MQITDCTANIPVGAAADKDSGKEEYLPRESANNEYFNTPYEGNIEIPDGVKDIRGVKILHIGDTESKHYPYFKRLIEEIDPDVILHTGDVADEVKVGRLPGTRYEYRSKIKFLLGCLERSRARLIVVPGNNDVWEDIKEFAPRAEVYPKNTLIELDGVECRISHQVSHVTFDRQWSFYGHGFTGEVWDYSMNKSGGECRFNACLGSFVCSLSEDKFYIIPTPKIKREM